MSLLEVKNLRIEYPSRHGVHAAVKSLSFNIERGEIVGVVGESGAGKSTVGNAVIDLLSPPGQIASGDVFLDEIERQLVERGAKVERYKKPTFSKPAPVDLRHEIATQCTLVIEALAD